jgi:CheY-like chemotaxis protein
MARKRVLIVDDDLNVRGAIREVLGRCGYELLEPGGGSEGLTKAERLRPDVILPEVRMGRFDGYEVCRNLTANVRTRHIPLIFVTGFVTGVDEDAEFHSAREAGAYLTKPFSS